MNFFKMVFAKIQDFQRRLKTRSEAPTKKVLLGAIFADTLGKRVVAHPVWANVNHEKIDER